MYTFKLDHYKFEVGIEVGIEFFPVEPFLIWERGGGAMFMDYQKFLYSLGNNYVGNRFVALQYLCFMFVGTCITGVG